jgi:hypothetical protein
MKPAKNRIQIASFALIAAVGLSSIPGWAAENGRTGPCKDKREAKHAAHKTLHECLKSWAKDNQVDSADPTDDCSSKLSSFVQASKDFKTCRVEHHKR